MKSTKNKTHLHVHVTVNNFLTVTPKAWKKTTIVLSNNGRWQTDKMYTKHFYLDNSIDFSQHVLVHIGLLPLSCDNIIRVKIEQESNFPEYIGNNQYLEIHAECKDFKSFPEKWVFSYNPHNQDSNFVNTRIRTGIIKDELRKVDNILNQSGYVYRPELIIYDSLPEHDSWWA